MKSKTRIKADPARKVPKEDLMELPSIFVDRKQIEFITQEVLNQDEKNIPYASDHVLRGVIHLAALAIPDAVISRSLSIPLVRVRAILKSESVRQEVERIQIDHYTRDAQQMFKRLVPTAVQNIFDLMTKKVHKESTRLDAAKYIVDRALGKPKEHVEMKTDMLAEVFSALHKKDKPEQKPIEVEFGNVDGEAVLAVDPLEDILSQ